MPDAALTSFDDALDFLSAFTNYERVPPARPNVVKLGLERMNALLEAIGNPQHELSCIHIAGTKGKGSTAAMIERILRRTGTKVGVYSSPHVEGELERIQIDGRWITPQQALEHFRRMHPYLVAAMNTPEAYRPTFFEIFTAMAFMHFQQENVDWAVIEVGLGGRLDATNVISPKVCAITTIDFDHTDRLGNTLELIAGEKAGIVKAGVPVVVSHQRPEALDTIRDKASEREASTHCVDGDIRIVPAEDGSFAVRTWKNSYSGLRTTMLGEHQRQNAAAAVGVIETLNDLGLVRADENTIRAGLVDAVLRGRVEVVSQRPAVVIDVAHNVASVKALLDTIDAYLPHRQMHLVFSCAMDKDANAMFRLFAPRAHRVVLTKINNPRAMALDQLEDAAAEAGCQRVSIVPEIAAAVAEAARGAADDDLICVAGSFYLAGDARRAWDRIEQQKATLRAASA